VSHDPDLALCTAPTTGYSERYMKTLEERMRQELRSIGLLEDEDEQDNNENSHIDSNDNSSHRDLSNDEMNHAHHNCFVLHNHRNNHEQIETQNSDNQSVEMRELCPNNKGDNKNHNSKGEKEETEPRERREKQNKDREDDEISSLFRSLQSQLRDQKAINDRVRSHLSSLALLEMENYQKELAKTKEFRDTELSYANLMRMKKKQKRRTNSTKTQHSE